MSFKEGVSLDKVEEGNYDIDLSMAGSDLFEGFTEASYTVDTDELFNSVQVSIVEAEQDNDLFESKIEYKHVTNDVSNSNQIINNTIALIIICCVVIIAYIYTIYQKKSMRDNIKTSKELVRTIK